MVGDAHGAETQREQPQVSGTGWEKAIAERDGRIAALEQQVADAAKNADAPAPQRGTSSDEGMARNNP